MKKFVDTQNPQTRPDGQYANVISQIAQDGVCPFCTEHLKKYHKPAVSTKKHWLVTDNMYPYKPARHHRLIIHKTHIRHISDISPDAWQELKTIIDEETQSRSVGGGTLIIRFGDTHFTGASVSHLHAHIVQSNPEDPTYDQQKGMLMRIG